MDALIYEGWQYVPVLDGDEPPKIQHHVKHVDGRRREMDLSPYWHCDAETLRMMVQMNFPRRIGAAPLSRRDVQNLYDAVCGAVGYVALNFSSGLTSISALAMAVRKTDELAGDLT